MYYLFIVQDLHGYLLVHLDSVQLVRTNLQAQHLTWTEREPLCLHEKQSSSSAR